MWRARTYLLGVGAAGLSVGLGLAALAMLGAPKSYLILNSVSFGLGALLGGLLLAMRASAPRTLVLAALAGGAAVVLTAFFGVSLEGVRRWVQLGPVLVHVGVMALPFVLAALAQSRSLIASLPAVLMLVGVSLQPDAAVASATAIGAVVIAATRPPFRFARAIATLAVLAAAWCWFQPDTLPSVTFVEHVVPLAFAHGLGLGALALIGLAIPALALLALGLVGPGNRPTALALGAGWAGLTVASLVGNYPTPMIGYGFSPIIAYLLSWSLLAGGGNIELKP